MENTNPIPSDIEITSLAIKLCEDMCLRPWEKEIYILHANYKLEARRILMEHYLAKTTANSYAI